MDKKNHAGKMRRQEVRGHKKKNTKITPRTTFFVCFSSLPINLKIKTYIVKSNGSTTFDSGWTCLGCKTGKIKFKENIYICIHMYLIWQGIE